MITLYGGRGGSSLRPHWMLNELGLPYETKSVELSKGEHKTPEFLAINPAGQIPAISIDGLALAESTVIAHYLAAKYKPELLGATLEEQAKGSQWALWILLNVQSAFHKILMPKWTGVADDAGIAAGKEKLSQILPTLEAYLGTVTYLAGQNFTVADVNGVTTFTYARMAEYDLSNYPNISAWMARCEDRAAYKAAVAG